MVCIYTFVYIMNWNKFAVLKIYDKRSIHEQSEWHIMFDILLLFTSVYIKKTKTSTSYLNHVAITPASNGAPNAGY